MGLLDWFRKPKSKVPVQVREKEVSEALRKTVEKDKNHGGDPFYEYRKKNILPEEFEYGMNCFLDRIFEQEGKEVAQKTYEELKMMGGCTLNEVTSSVDVAGLPILFGVKNIIIGLEAHNKAISILKKEFREKLLTDNPIFLGRLEDETENEFVLRLGIISMGFTDKSFELNKQGKLFESQRLSLYSSLIDKEILPPYDHVQISHGKLELETFFATGALFRNIIPNEEIELDKFLLLIGPDFWHTFWVGIFEYFKANSKQEPFTAASINMFAYAFTRDEDEKISTEEEKWKKDIRNLGDWNIAWERIQKRQAEEASQAAADKGLHSYTGLPRDFSLFLSVVKFLTVFGYRGENFSKLIADADRGILKFLCFKLVAETIKDQKQSKNMKL
ncbi:MAG: hypothetical protein PHU34_02135 [Candidatus Methanoperedens sp.]|nr:hypothetical protein [Candidatus Methanoperedens sp.]